MQKRSDEPLKKRQAQWDAFHQWEASRQIAPLSLEERVDWYLSAGRFSRVCSSAAPAEEIQTRVEQIGLVRERLAHLQRG